MRRNFPRYHSCSPGWGALTGLLRESRVMQTVQLRGIALTFCLNATTRTDLPPQCVCIHGFTLSARKRYPVGTSCHALAPPAHSLRHSVPRLLRHSRLWLLYHIFPGLSRLNPNFFAHSPDFRRRAHPRRISPRRLSSCIRFRESHTARRRTSRRRNRRFPRIRNRRFRVR